MRENHHIFIEHQTAKLSSANDGGREEGGVVTLIFSKGFLTMRSSPVSAMQSPLSLTNTPHVSNKVLQ